jgi:ATP-binding cassette subfamily B protein
VVGTSISLALRNTLLFVGGLVMLFVTSARLTSIILGLLVLTVVPIVLFGRRVRKLSRDSQDRIADASALAGEILNAMPTVQAFTHEKIEARASACSVEGAFATAMRRIRARGADHAGHRAGVRRHRVRAVAGRARGAVRVHDRRRPRPVHPVRLDRLGRGRRAVRSDGRSAARCRRRRAPARTAGAALEHPGPGASARAAPAQRRRRGPEPGQVHFSYPSRPSPRRSSALDLDIRPGETVAVVGPSGAGKTTLFQLLLRFYDPQSGAIRLDGVDIRDLDLHTCASAIGIVPQDTVIFSADAMENIRYGRPMPATPK